MEIGIYIWMIVVVFLIVLGFILLKKFIKIMLIVSFVLLIIFGVFSYLLYQDVKDMQEGFSELSSIVLLEDNGNILTGVKIGQKSKMITQDEFELYKENSNDLEKLKEDYYKVMLVKLEILQDLEEVEVFDKKVNGKKAINILKSNTPSVDFLGAGYKGRIVFENEDVTITDPLKFKAAFFGVLFTNEILKNGNPLSLLSYYKQGDIVIYPETILFKVFKRLPISLVKGVFSTAKEKAEEKIKREIDGFE